MSHKVRNYTLISDVQKTENYSRLNRKYNQRKAVDVLIGLSLGILADGEINADEATFFNEWLKTNREVIPKDITKALRPHLSAIEDNTFDQNNCELFVKCLFDLVGQETHEDSKPEAEIMGKPSPLFNDTVDAEQIIFEGKAFVLSGTFQSGQKKDIEEQIIAVYATIHKSLRKVTDYLVIGGKGSADWRHSNYGSKIDKVLANRDNGATTQIISEELLIEALALT